MHITVFNSSVFLAFIFKRYLRTNLKTNNFDANSVGSIMLRERDRKWFLLHIVGNVNTRKQRRLIHFCVMYTAVNNVWQDKLFEQVDAHGVIEYEILFPDRLPRPKNVL